MKRRREAIPIKKRSRARMLALQALCAFEGIGEQFGAQLGEFLCDEQVLIDLEIAVPPPAELVDFARTLAQGAWERRDALDEKLAQSAAHWSVARMTPVDRNILRLGLYELLAQPETPPQVVINEAIELARRFGDADSPAFVNGVLDAVRRELAAAAEQPPDDPADPEATDGTEGGNGAV